MKTVFDTAVRNELVERVNKITMKSERKFGTMRPDQALHHINADLQMALGDINATFHGSPLKAALLKFSVLSPLPIPKAKGVAPPELMARGSYNIESEQSQFKELIERLGAKSNQKEWPFHAQYGKMTARQYGVIEYKHTHHHLKQFGV